MDLAEGIYRLSADAVNPEADGRRRDYFREPIWREGDRFLVRSDSTSPDAKEIVPLSGRGGGLLLASLRETIRTRLAALVPHLVLEGDTLESILSVSGVSESLVLTRLLESGAVSLDDVRAAVDPYRTAMSNAKPETGKTTVSGSNT